MTMFYFVYISRSLVLETALKRQIISFLKSILYKTLDMEICKFVRL